MRTEDKVSKKRLNEVLMGRKGGEHKVRTREIEFALADEEIDQYLNGADDTDYEDQDYDPTPNPRF